MKSIIKNLIVCIGIFFAVTLSFSDVYADFECITPYGDMEDETIIGRDIIADNAELIYDAGLSKTINNHVLYINGKNGTTYDDDQCHFKAKLIKGHRYIINFDYKSDTPVGLWGINNISVWARQDWQRYQGEFTAEWSESAAEVNLISLFAQNTQESEFCIDNLYLYDITNVYTLNITECKGAKVEVISGAGKMYAHAQQYARGGDTVKVRVSCTDSAYSKYTAELSNGSPCTIDESGIISFQMPAEDVILKVSAESKVEVDYKKNKVEVKFNDAQKACVIAAEYDGDTLKNAYLRSLDVSAGEVIEVSSLPEFSQITDWEKTHIYVWSGHDTLRPLTEKYTVHTYYDKYNECNEEWQPVPIVSQKIRDNGLTGGEGCQVLFGMDISRDGQFMVVGVDVAGVLKSNDGGKNWQKTGVNYYGGSCSAIEIDPNDKNTVVAVTNTCNADAACGIYISTDGADTFKQTLSTAMVPSGTNSSWRNLAIDGSSYDDTLKRSSTMYWSARAHRDGTKDGTAYGLWRSDNGGESWNLVNEMMSNCMIRVHPTKGYVYAAASDGIYVSRDKGVTFKKTFDGEMFSGLDVIDSRSDSIYDDYVYANDRYGVWISKDCGENFEKVSGDTFPIGLSSTDYNMMTANLAVSPLIPQNMVLSWGNVYNVASKKYFSHDGGKTWTEENLTDDDNSFFLKNNRRSIFVWSPVEAGTVFGFGGDYVVKSQDSGINWYYSFNGGNMATIQQRSFFNVYNPDLICMGNQDYDGAFSTDGGYTWKSICMQNGSPFTGAVYGAYAADENTLIVLGATGQDKDGNRVSEWGSTVEIRISRDGADTWINTGVVLDPIQNIVWKQSCMQSLNNKNVLFASCMRSTDYGYTWEKMQGCEAVVTYNPYGSHELYGLNKGNIVVSYDEGATWSEYYHTGYERDDYWNIIYDLSYDGINDIMYYAGDLGFGKIQAGVRTDMTAALKSSDCCGGTTVCAVDPRYPNVIYVGNGIKLGANSYGIQRSVDGGKSFQVLTRGIEDSEISFTGTICGGSIVKSGGLAGINVQCIMVHPTNGDVWITEGCYGISKFAPPYNEK